MKKQEERAMTVGEVCRRDVLFAEKSLSASEAARLMRCYKVGDLVALEKKAGRNRVVGVLSDRDIVAHVMSTGVAPDSLTVGDIVVKDCATLTENEDVRVALCRIREKCVQRMPVVDGKGSLVGLVTLEELQSRMHGSPSGGSQGGKTVNR
ncbi:MAG: CBS domain-containing protein [Thiobacillus sp.]